MMPIPSASVPVPPALWSLVLTLVLAGGPIAARHASTQPAAAVDHEAIARRIVEQSARVQDGELVWIQGGTQELDLMERLAVAVGRAGGQPLVSVFSNEMLRRWYAEVPERFDERREEWLWKRVELADVIIEFDSFDPATFAGLAPERSMAWERANAGWRERMRERGVRVVRVGNDLFPTPARATSLGVDRAELERLFWDGVLTDPEHLLATGGRLRELLRTASTIRVTHPNGTDIRVALGEGRIVVTDGTTTLPSGAGGPLNITWLPAGEVTAGLDPASAEGRLVVERTFFDGEEIEQLTLSFSAGRLRSMASGSDLTRIRQVIESSPPASGRLTGLKFGINPRLTDSRVLPLMGAGMISLSMGSNIALGGAIDHPFTVFFSLAGSTVFLDDRLVVEAGVLKF